MQRALAPAPGPPLADVLLTLALVRVRRGDTTGVAALAAEAQGVRAAWAPGGAAVPPARTAALGEALCALGRPAEGAPALRRGLAALAGAQPADTAAVGRAERALARCVAPAAGGVGP
jgi:hypothetical protein